MVRAMRLIPPEFHPNREILAAALGEEAAGELISSSSSVGEGIRLPDLRSEIKNAHFPLPWPSNIWPLPQQLWGRLRGFPMAPPPPCSSSRRWEWGGPSHRSMAGPRQAAAAMGGPLGRPPLRSAQPRPRQPPLRLLWAWPGACMPWRRGTGSWRRSWWSSRKRWDLVWGVICCDDRD